MKVVVTKESVCITQSIVVNESDYLVNKCTFEFPACFEGLTVTAVFNNIPVPLAGTQCYIPSLKQGTAILGVYAYSEQDNGDLQLMYSPKPTCFYVNKGSYSNVKKVEEIPSISEFEKYCAAISELTFPKSNIVEYVTIDEQVSHSQVYSAAAVNSAFAEVSYALGMYHKKIEDVDNSSEKTANKVTSVSENTNHTQYPSARAVYESVNEQQKNLEKTAQQISKDIIAVHDRINLNVSDIKKLKDKQNEINSAVTTLESSAAELNSSISSLEENLSRTQNVTTQLEQTTHTLSADLTELSQSCEKDKSLTQGMLSECANALKGEIIGAGQVCIDDISPVVHNVEVTVSGEAGINMSDVVVECVSKNLLGFEERIISDFNTTGHSFTGNNLFLSVAGTNYYSKDLGSYEYDAETRILTYNCGREWYGLGLDVKIEPGETYTLSAKRVTENFVAVVSFYDADGKYVSYISNAVSKSFTAPENAEWIVVILTAKARGISGEFEALQLEKGSVATEFCSFYSGRYFSPDSSGKIEPFESIAPAMIIKANNPALTLACRYNRDIVKTIRALENAVKAMGATL